MPTGVLAAALLGGIAAFAGALMAGAPWWLAFLVYSLTGSVLAVAMAVLPFAGGPLRRAWARAGASAQAMLGTPEPLRVRAR